MLSSTPDLVEQPFEKKKKKQQQLQQQNMRSTWCVQTDDEATFKAVQMSGRLNQAHLK